MRVTHTHPLSRERKEGDVSFLVSYAIGDATNVYEIFTP